MKMHLVLATAACALLPACADSPVASGDPYYSGASYRADNDGRVVSIERVRDERDRGSTIAGTVLGGVIGGVLGHQIGSGRGKDAATVAGAVGGAAVGHELSERRGDHEYYRVTVRFRDRHEESFAMDELNGIRVGDRVRADGGRLYRG